MAFRLKREKTDLTPYVLIDEENGYMNLEGESYHENIYEFFSEIKEWLDGYLNTDFESFTFDFELKYFNSSTVRILLGMLRDMDKSACVGNISVNWITAKGNKIIIECGEKFQECLKNLKMNFIINE
ncbi:MAG: DUF1987 domain-containing protein [Oscillospiraceae bacterium]|nr:DUF1987 domain-containing protein [Oscillospiraceae bacterium]